MDELSERIVAVLVDAIRDATRAQNRVVVGSDNVAEVASMVFKRLAMFHYLAPGRTWAMDAGNLTDLVQACTSRGAARSGATEWASPCSTFREHAESLLLGLTRAGWLVDPSKPIP